jgi:hypothetical protein
VGPAPPTIGPAPTTDPRLVAVRDGNRWGAVVRPAAMDTTELILLMSALVGFIVTLGTLDPDGRRAAPALIARTGRAARRGSGPVGRRHP